MGVGVYRSDFSGAGKTFGVSPDFRGADDYEAAVRDAVAEGEAPPSRESFLQDLYNSDEDDMINQVEEVLAGLGFDMAERGHLNLNVKNRAPFDSEFVYVGEKESIAVGWRSWESDYVIGVGPSRQWLDRMQDPEAYADEIQEDTGRSAVEVHSAHMVAVEAVTSALIKHMTSMGIDCRYPTSGYTTAGYSKATEDEVKVAADAASAALGELKSMLTAPESEPSLSA